MARTKAVTSLAVVLACCACAFALDPALDISQYAHTTWKLREGFTKGAIYSIAQTPDGYLWLGTEFGLVRFDGVRAVPWQPPGNQPLPAGTIFSLLVAHDGTLWIGAKGLASWKDGKLKQYAELAEQFVFALREDHEGTVWAGSDARPYGRLCAIRDATVLCYGKEGTLGIGVTTLYEDSKGNLWAGVYNGLWKWKPGSPKFYSVPCDRNGIRSINEDADGAFLIAWRSGIYRFIDGKIRRYSPGTISRQLDVNRMLRDRGGSLWVGNLNYGLSHVHRGRADVFSAVHGLSGNDIYAFFEDREGDVWVSTEAGLDRFHDSAVATFTNKQGLSGNSVASVLGDSNGSVWLSTSVGLNRWKNGQITIAGTGNSGRDGRINGHAPGSLFQDLGGRIWVSTNQELGYLENGKFTSIRGVPAGSDLSIAEDSARNLWVINEENGIFCISPRNVRRIQWAELGHSDHATVLAPDPTHGGLWIGFFQGGLSYYSDGQVRQSYTSNDGLGPGLVSDLFFDNEGVLWVSTEGGLSRLKKDRIATLNNKNGLPCDTVHWAIEDDDHAMWLYTACGLFRIARSELDRWALALDQGRDTTRQVQLTVFDNSDGVKTHSRSGELHPQVAKATDGKLWFLPWDGISTIDPHHLAFNKIPPPVRIEQIIADRKTYDTGSSGSADVRLPPLVRDLEIDYTALSFVAPEKNHFRYKLEGLDKEWHDVGNRRQAFYTDLPPRKYRFRVAASNNSGVWNEEGALLQFIVPPMWYQTNWFRAGCVALFFAMLWGIHELRVRQLAHEFNMGLEQRVAERTRIARELHDTLLQSFQALLPRLQASINMFSSRPDDARRNLEQAADQASQAIAEGRDAIQGMRMSTVEKNDLAVAIRTLGEELASAAKPPSPNFNVVVEGTSRNLHPILRDEVYRLATEALRNAFRHAAAQNVEVEIRYDEKYFRLRIRDDGKGIPSDVLSGDGREGHYGLPGMRERAKLVGGKLTIWTEVDGGTEIELNIPGARAFVKSTRPFWYFGKRSATGTDEKEPIERE